MKRWMPVATILCCAGCATMPDGFQTGAGWNCAANGIKTAEYGGGDVASIQLQNEAQASVYTVSRVDEKTARGVTRNGTLFVCRKPA